MAAKHRVANNKLKVAMLDADVKDLRRRRNSASRHSTSTIWMRRACTNCTIRTLAQEGKPPLSGRLREPQEVDVMATAYALCGPTRQFDPKGANVGVDKQTTSILYVGSKSLSTTTSRSSWATAT